MQLVVQFRHLQVAHEPHLLQVLAQVVLVMAAPVLVRLVLAVPLVAPVPQADRVLPVLLVLSDPVDPVVAPVALEGLVVDPVVLVVVVPVVLVVVVPVVALAQAVDVALRAAVVVVAVVVRMIYSHQ